MKKMILQGVPYTKQILPVSTFMELNGFLISSAIKYIWTFKVDTPTAGHPVFRELGCGIHRPPIVLNSPKCHFSQL